MDYETVKINENQMKYYEEIEKNSCKMLVDKYSKVLNLSNMKKNIFILDIGGASGYFLREICKIMEMGGNSHCICY